MIPRGWVTWTGLLSWWQGWDEIHALQPCGHLEITWKFKKYQCPVHPRCSDLIGQEWPGHWGPGLPSFCCSCLPRHHVLCGVLWVARYRCICHSLFPAHTCVLSYPILLPPADSSLGLGPECSHPNMDRFGPSLLSGCGSHTPRRWHILCMIC